MLYMTLEGNRPGRVFVNQLTDPSMALIWTGMEYAYLVGESTNLRAAIVKVVEERIVPALDKAGLDFLTLFLAGVSPSDVVPWFPQRRPVSFGVNSFSFERDRFESTSRQAKPLQPGYQLVKLDRHTLEQAPYQGIREDILFCWETLERFEALGLGTSIRSSQGRAVSACYALAYGAEAYHINIWTHPDHRRKGLARYAAAAFLDESLGKKRPIYWINDAPNIASRRLAESLGFVYTGDLATVDIPVHPGAFHVSLAEHFADYLGLYRQAGELYDTALTIQEGDTEAFQKAATLWDQAGDIYKAEEYRRKAHATGN
jgi:RimJ/RimL family protein N-acetyltransferase